MKKLLTVIALTTQTLGATLLCTQSTFAQAPTIEWQKRFGGNQNDIPSSVIQTNNGGYIIAGITYSTNIGQHGTVGSSDGFLVKLNYFGKTQWQKCYGGTNHDNITSILQTPDTGYIFTGTTGSTDGDINNYHGGPRDLWLVKINKSGDIQWSKCLGGTAEDAGNNIIASSKGGYVVCGYTNSNDGDVTGCHSTNYDAWVVKVDSAGNIQWQKCYGGTDAEYGNKIIEKNDGYVFIGSSNSNNGNVTGHHGGIENDIWVVSIDFLGNIQWQKSIGGTNTDDGTSITKACDGGYIVVGTTQSNDYNISGNHGGSDYFVAKLNSSGNISWKKCYGGSSYEYLCGAISNIDSTYYVFGGASSHDGQVTGNHTTNLIYDGWILKINKSGGIVWKKCYGTNSADAITSICSTTDGGIALGCQTDEPIFGVPYGNTDYWFVKLGFNQLKNETEFVEQNENVIIYPNPATENLNIELQSEILEQSQVLIYDLFGKKVYENKCLESINIDVSNFLSGIYFVKIQNDSEQIVRKIIKE